MNQNDSEEIIMSMRDYFMLMQKAISKYEGPTGRTEGAEADIRRGIGIHTGVVPAGGRRK
jgi:hypothetical protein